MKNLLFLLSELSRKLKFVQVTDLGSVRALHSYVCGNSTSCSASTNIGNKMIVRFIFLWAMQNMTEPACTHWSGQAPSDWDYKANKTTSRWPTTVESNMTKFSKNNPADLILCWPTSSWHVFSSLQMEVQNTSSFKMHRFSCNIPCPYQWLSWMFSTQWKGCWKIRHCFQLLGYYIKLSLKSIILQLI